MFDLLQKKKYPELNPPPETANEIYSPLVLGQAQKNEALVLVNLGTPSGSTSSDIKKYLSEFLSDRRVIHPDWKWSLVKNIVITLRSPASAKLYQSIWTEAGSPLASEMQQLTTKVQKQSQTPVRWAGRYGEPSLEEVISALKNEGCRHFKILPLFPQYSHSTVGSVNDAIQKIHQQHADLSFTMLQGYAHQDSYLHNMQKHYEEELKDINRDDYHLLFSFHSLPQDYIVKGDPYEKQCLNTAHELAKALKLKDWSLSWQSQFGPAQWLSPSTRDAIITAGRQHKNLILLTPGFSVDCLETLEELDHSYKNIFLNQGGGHWCRPSCLNDSGFALDLVTSLLKS